MNPIKKNAQSLFKKVLVVAILFATKSSFACFNSTYYYTCVDQSEPEQEVVLLSDYFCSESDYRHIKEDHDKAIAQKAAFKLRGDELADSRGFSVQHCFISTGNIEK